MTPQATSAPTGPDKAAKLGSAGGAPQLRRLLRQLERYATLLGFAFIVLFFWITEPSFGTWDNIRSILDQSAALIILAVGLTVVLSTGEFDLSFPGAVGLSAVCAVKLMEGGSGAALAVLAALAVGVGTSLIAGVLVSMQRASSFIITFALSTVWTGVALAMSNEGSTITTVTNGFLDITSKEVFGLPLTVIYAAVFTIGLFALMRWTVFGQQVQAIGSNPMAARLAGVPLSVTRIASFGVFGLCVGAAAVILSSRNGAWSPDISAGIFLPPFVAAYFGISVLLAGRFNVIGTVVGALFVGTLQTGLIIKGAQASLTNIITGLVLVVILMTAVQRKRRE